MTRQVRCPSPTCRRVFELSAERLGRNMHCPTCGVRMTARPLSVEAQLREQQLRVEGSGGAPIPNRPAVLVDSVRSLWNVGSIFRTADACGFGRVALAGISGCPPRPEISKTALGAEQVVPWSYHADAWEALDELVTEGFSPVALETSPHAVTVDAMEWPRRTCLIVGNEVAGISPGVLEACRHHVSIPMRGVKNSLNVAVAFGIAAHAAARAWDHLADSGSARTAAGAE